VYSEKLPHEKTELVSQLKKDGPVLMIGDGINDAPSLTSADVGMSFADATRIAMNSASVILLKGSAMDQIPLAVKAGRQTMKTIKQNLFWAFFYNVVAIPIAAAGMLSPMVAAFSMAFSDVVVIGNSLRLRFIK
jgi:Cu+-exporting ATPase